MRRAYLVIVTVGFGAVGIFGCKSDPSGDTSTSSIGSGGGSATSSTAQAASTNGAASSASSGVGGDGGSAPIDPCATDTQGCPGAPSGFGEGQGILSINRCAFGLAQGSAAATYAARIGELSNITAPTSLAAMVADTDRDANKVTSVPGAPPGLAYAFSWNDEEEASTRWFPQGITGSPDASQTGMINGKKIIAVSFYDNGTGSYEKGARVAFVDITDPQTPAYRFALLVEPIGVAGAPNIGIVPVHAGGIVWIGDLLYVVETGKGFRVFDTSRILKVATDVDEIGCTGTTCHAGLYKYVIPEIDAFHTTSMCSPIFSFVSLDRSSSPPSLVSGEYCSDTACTGPLAGRLFRWPLDATTGKLPSGASWPSEAFLMGQRQVQGGAFHNSLGYLSSSAPGGSGGALYRVTTQKSSTSTWANSPEDLMIDDANSQIWSLSEGVGNRYVFAAALSAYPAP